MVSQFDRQFRAPENGQQHHVHRNDKICFLILHIRQVVLERKDLDIQHKEAAMVLEESRLPEAAPSETPSQAVEDESSAVTGSASTDDAVDAEAEKHDQVDVVADDGDFDNDDEEWDTNADVPYVALSSGSLSDDEELDPASAELDREEEAERCPAPLTITVSKEAMMSENDVATISSVMASFSFPASAIPAWAKDVPEETWMPKVLYGADPASR
ncbi:uncharacterized protein EV422DRAFT_422335 [Fimicolochytrium jonesii]|uniref:uncharacterized protein n=1 Tax=Fimicolochytrium jonesii TaxID=1396493 RepID=UPI0022FF403D|nr:uncharacterized protein EV422DRAFT_422335 [Fimicolochytrium jonesii]KAI8822238.1 hypothetical protein EV422DRAFT_422335 [Fimicolochytrium jonesii]